MLFFWTKKSWQKMYYGIKQYLSIFNIDNENKSLLNSKLAY